MTSMHAANPSTAQVTVTVPALVQITQLNDITLSPTSINGLVTGNTSACIYTNIISPLGSYYLTATSINGTAGAFRVNNGTNFITYNAYWNSNSTPTATLALSSGVKTVQQTGGNSTSLTCEGTPNANFNIIFSNLQIAGARPGVYTDTVTLLISPS